MSILDDYLDPDRHLYGSEEPEEYSDAWECLNGLFGYDADNRDEKRIQRAVYKCTDCGAWIEFDADGITLGSIVEGSDFGCATYRLGWRNVTEQAVTERLAALEDEASAVWEWANETRDDGLTDAERGIDFPDVSWDYRHLQ
jgi:hypothetical protein